MLGVIRKSVLFSLALFYAVPLGTMLFLKIVALGVLLGSLLLVFHVGINRISVKSLQLFFFSAVVLFWSVLMLHVNGAEDGGSFTLFTSIFVGCIIVFTLSHLVYNRFLTRSNLISAFVFGVFGYSIFKDVLQFFPSSFTEQVFTVLGISSNTSSSIGIGDAFRFNFSNDFFIPFAAYFTWRDPHILKRRSLLIIVNIVFLVSVLVSFTRSIWILYILLFIYNYGGKALLVLCGILILLLMMPVDLPFGELYAAMELRVGAEGAASIDEKWYQVPVLVEEIKNFFLFGKGLGSYVEDYVRSDVLKYGYEVYFLVLFLHFGFIGVLFITIVFTIATVGALKRRENIINYFSLFFLFISYGFTNPVIVSTLSIIFYFVLLVFSSGIKARD